jgi:hypothetical protein
MPFLSLLAFPLFVWLFCSAAAADPILPPNAPQPRVWSGVILATNQPHPQDAPERVRKYAGKLKKIFGYNQFELVGESSDRMDDPNEHWLVPSKDFRLSVRSIPGSPTERRHAKIILFEGRHRVAEFETHLNPESPLFIRGPLYAHGQLVIVVHADAYDELAHSPHPALVANPLLGVPVNRERLASPPVIIVPRGVVPPPPVRIVAPYPAYPVQRFGPPYPVGPGSYPVGPYPNGPYPGAVRTGEPVRVVAP